MHTKQIARIAMLVAVAFVLSYIESVFPLNLGVPGVKAGFSNIVVVLCLYESSMKETIGISFVRILLVGLTFGNLYSLLYSLAGGLLSLTVMALLKKAGGFSVIGISIAGGVCHNIGQLVVAMIVVETFAMSYYMPVLLVAGLITGFLIGVVADQVLRRISDIMFLE